MRIAGARGIFPLARQSVGRLVATRLALIGEAAHVFPPIGAQGLNLGLRDVKALVAATAASGDLGGPRRSPLMRARAPRRAVPHRRGRRAQSLAARRLRRRSISLRSPGLAALGAIGPLRRLTMREGVAPLFAR